MNYYFNLYWTQFYQEKIPDNFTPDFDLEKEIRDIVSNDDKIEDLYQRVRLQLNVAVNLDEFKEILIEDLVVNRDIFDDFVYKVLYNRSIKSLRDPGYIEDLEV